MKNDIKIAGDITFSQLNPHNFSLKNDYINNLFTTALMIIPRLYQHLNENIELIKGFVSKQYITDNYTEMDKHVYKHGEGLGLEFKLPDNKERLLISLRQLLNDIEEPLEIRINLINETFSCFRDVRESAIFEISSAGERVIYKA